MPLLEPKGQEDTNGQWRRMIVRSPEWRKSCPVGKSEECGGSI